MIRNVHRKNLLKKRTENQAFSLSGIILYIRERQRNRPICESWSRKRQARKSRREIEITLTMEKGITLILMSRKKAAPRDAADENGLFD